MTFAREEYVEQYVTARYMVPAFLLKPRVGVSRIGVGQCSTSTYVVLPPVFFTSADFVVRVTQAQINDPMQDI